MLADTVEELGEGIIEYVIPHEPSGILNADGTCSRVFTSLKFSRDSDPKEMHRAVYEFIRDNFYCEGGVNMKLKELGFDECIQREG